MNQGFRTKKKWFLLYQIEPPLSHFIFYASSCHCHPFFRQRLVNSAYFWQGFPGNTGGTSILLGRKKRTIRKIHTHQVARHRWETHRTCSGSGIWWEEPWHQTGWLFHFPAWATLIGLSLLYHLKNETTQKNWKQRLKQICVWQYSLQHYLQ